MRKYLTFLQIIYSRWTVTCVSIQLNYKKTVVYDDSSLETYQVKS